MKLYKLNEDLIVQAVTNGTMPTDEGGSFYPDKVDETERNNYGYYTFVLPDETENTEYNRLIDSSIQLVGDTYTMVYTYEDIPLNEMKTIRIINLDNEVKANKRPSVEVPLESPFPNGVETIHIWGSRNDQYDIREKYNLMAEDSIAYLNQRDVDDNIWNLFHKNIKRCGKAIMIRRNEMFQYQMEKELEINACTTIDELKLVTWTI